ncbi:MAG: hypothetical protein LIP01_04820, partial [Tannerellaceae bacterium]|nr:hypothetical protein [Tannerellaceae bacterium]
SWSLVLTGVLFSFIACSDDEREEIPESSKVVSEISFNDTDKTYEKIGGILSWKAPEKLQESIDGYVIYLSENENAKGTKIGEVDAVELSFTIPSGTTYKEYIQVVVKRGELEDSEFVSEAIVDRTNTVGYYVLNRGNWKENNASIGYMDMLTGEYTTNFYKKVNGNDLGDSAQDIIRYGSKLYVTVSTSNRLLVLDETGKLLKEHRPLTTAGEDVQPRYLTAHDGHVYVSYFYGHAVAKLDTVDLEIKATVPVGTYPEQIKVSSNKLYVANSGYGSENTLSVIDLTSFQEEKKIEVVINPSLIEVDEQGDLFVISMGDYVDIKNTLQKIHISSGVVETIGNATIMCLHNNDLYTVYAQWGETQIEALGFVKFDTKTGTASDTNFIKDGTEIANPNSIDVDPSSGEIYIADYDYAATNDIYIFGSDGKLHKKLDTEGYYTGKVLFWLD